MRWLPRLMATSAGSVEVTVSVGATSLSDTH